MKPKCSNLRTFVAFLGTATVVVITAGLVFAAWDDILLHCSSPSGHLASGGAPHAQTGTGDQNGDSQAHGEVGSAGTFGIWAQFNGANHLVASVSCLVRTIPQTGQTEEKCIAVAVCTPGVQTSKVSCEVEGAGEALAGWNATHEKPYVRCGFGSSDWGPNC